MEPISTSEFKERVSKIRRYLESKYREELSYQGIEEAVDIIIGDPRIIRYMQANRVPSTHYREFLRECI
jgi:hypothetical protein